MTQSVAFRGIVSAAGVVPLRVTSAQCRLTDAADGDESTEMTSLRPCSAVAQEVSGKAASRRSARRFIVAEYAVLLRASTQMIKPRAPDDRDTATRTANTPAGPRPLGRASPRGSRWPTGRPR